MVENQIERELHKCNCLLTSFLIIIKTKKNYCPKKQRANCLTGTKTSPIRFWLLSKPSYKPSRTISLINLLKLYQKGLFFVLPFWRRISFDRRPVSPGRHLTFVVFVFALRFSLDFQLLVSLHLLLPSLIQIRRVTEEEQRLDCDNRNSQANKLNCGNRRILNILAKKLKIQIYYSCEGLKSLTLRSSLHCAHG
jgi:hypothetical protein